MLTFSTDLLLEISLGRYQESDTALCVGLKSEHAMHMMLLQTQARIPDSGSLGVFQVAGRRFAKLPQFSVDQRTNVCYLLNVVVKSRNAAISPTKRRNAVDEGGGSHLRVPVAFLIMEVKSKIDDVENQSDSSSEKLLVRYPLIDPGLQPLRSVMN